MTSETKRNNWVDALRFILICIIVVHHYTLRYSQLYPDAGFNYVFNKGGCIGNFVFMFISGFFLSPSLLNGFGIRSWAAYCVNKWWRFFPTAVLCMILIFIITHLMPIVDDRVVTIKQLFQNFLIVNLGWKPVDGSHWFMASLLQMQLFLSFLLFFKSIKTREFFLVILLLISSIVCVIGDFVDSSTVNIVACIMCAKWMPVLISGSICYLVLYKKVNAFYLLLPIAVSLFYVLKYRVWGVAILLVIFIYIYMCVLLGSNAHFSLIQWEASALFGIYFIKI